jgi:hypothetical protein
MSKPPEQPALEVLQCAIGQAVLGHDQAAILEAIRGDGIDPGARLRIYRHHYESSLTEALKAIYPVVCRLVDERFFAFAAHRYIEASPPRRVCLHEYGADFPEFLAGFPPCRDLAYLADVARLEQLINQSLHSPAEEALEIGEFMHVALGDYPRLVFRLAASLRYLESPWPVDRVWLANRPGSNGEVDLGEGGCRLEIRQQGEAVVFRRLDPAELELRRSLLAGATLEGAAAAALERDPLFDLAMGIRRLLAEGLVVNFRLAPEETRASDSPNHDTPNQETKP